MTKGTKVKLIDDLGLWTLRKLYKEEKTPKKGQIYTIDDVLVDETGNIFFTLEECPSVKVNPQTKKPIGTISNRFEFVEVSDLKNFKR